MPHKTLLKQQAQQLRIVEVSAWMQQKRIEEERASLSHLKLDVPDYLNIYDQLFRLVTLWLLDYGFDLTNHQPHQVLKAVCRFHCPELPIEAMVKHRHELKKRLTCTISQRELDTLLRCYEVLCCSLQAYDL